MARSTARLAVAWAWTLLLTLGAAWMALAMIDLYGWLDAGVAIRVIRVDGGAARNDLLLQFQADQLGVRVIRPVDRESTALGAAYLAGLAEGVEGAR